MRFLDVLSFGPSRNDLDNGPQPADPVLAPMPDSLTINSFVPGRYMVALWKNVAFVYWLQQGTIETVAAVRSALQLIYLQSGSRPVSVVHLIRDGAGLPEADVRAAVLAMSAHFATKTACLGIVLMGAGFWASAMQSILTALRVIAPQRSGLMRFSRSPDDLCQWFPSEHQRLSGCEIVPAELHVVTQRILREGDASHSAIG